MPGLTLRLSTNNVSVNLVKAQQPHLPFLTSCYPQSKISLRQDANSRWNDYSSGFGLSSAANGTLYISAITGVSLTGMEGEVAHLASHTVLPTRTAMSRHSYGVGPRLKSLTPSVGYVTLLHIMIVVA